MNELECDDLFAERIQVLIDNHGRKFLVEKTGISSAQIQRLRTGSDTTRRNLLRLCDATGVSLSWLAAGEGPMLPDGTEAPTKGPQFTADELEMLALFRSAPLMLKMQVVQALSSGAMPSGGQTVHGNNNRTAGGDVNG